MGITDTRWKDIITEKLVQFISILFMRIPLSTFNGSDIFSYRFTVHQVRLNELIPFKVQDTQLHTS